MDKYVELALRAIEETVRGGRVPDFRAEELPREMLTARAGAFVSLHRNGALRGCIGTIAPARETLAEEIVRNAAAAATEDPRFPPVRESELDQLEISVDVLGRPEPVRSRSELDVKRYGVIVRKGWRRGVLLPDLEGVDTVDDQIAIACRKAGIAPGESGIGIERFEVVRHV